MNVIFVGGGNMGRALAGGLLVAIPLCVLTAERRVGRWLREWQIAAIPEEHPARARAPAIAALTFQPQGEPE